MAHVYLGFWSLRTIRHFFFSNLILALMSSTGKHNSVATFHENIVKTFYYNIKFIKKKRQNGLLPPPYCVIYDQRFIPHGGELKIGIKLATLKYHIHLSANFLPKHSYEYYWDVLIICTYSVHLIIVNAQLRLQIV